MKTETLIAIVSAIVLVTAALLVPNGGQPASANPVPVGGKCPGNYNDCQTFFQYMDAGCGMTQGIIHDKPIDLCCPKASDPTKGTKITGLQWVIYGPVTVQCPNQSPVVLTSNSGKYCESTNVTYGNDCDPLSAD